MGQAEVPRLSICEKRKPQTWKSLDLASCVCSLTYGCITERNGKNDRHAHKHTNTYTQTHTQEVWHFTRITRPYYGMGGLANGSLSNFLRPYYVPGRRRSHTRILHPCSGRTGWRDFEQTTHILHNSFFPIPPPQMTVISLRLIKWSPLPPNLPTPCQASPFMQRLPKHP